MANAIFSIPVSIDMDDFHDTVDLLARVNEEVQAHDEEWGVQDHPLIGDLAGASEVRAYFATEADLEQASNSYLAKRGLLDWRGILLEEVYEALAEADPKAAEEELIQVAAVALNAIKSIRRNGLGGA